MRSGADLIVIGRDNLIGRGGRPSALDGRENAFRTIILDELSSFKSTSARRFRALRRFIRGSKTRPVVWGLTGTPMPNSMLDLWPQANLLDGGKALGTRVTSYRETYFRAGKTIFVGGSPIVSEWAPRPGAQESIFERLKPLALSMDSGGRVKLPPVTTNRVGIEMPPAAKRAYRDMHEEFVAAYDDQEFSAANAAVKTNKLSQITAGFLYGADGEPSTLHEAKLDALAEVIDSAQGSGVLVAYRYRAEADAIAARWPQARRVDADSLAAWDRGEVPILLAHPASAGHGLNLQHGGHTIVWTSPSWSSEETQQLNKRLARQGQRHPVVIHYLICAGTIDERIMDVVTGKRTREQALLDYLA